MRPAKGFEELPHTADWAMKVWAEDLPSLFSEAAQGMNALSGLVLSSAPRLSRTFQHDAPDDETLLVAFLSELIYAQEQDNLGFDTFHVELKPGNLKVDMSGAPVASVEKPIKAVTFHNLRITCTDQGCETEIVFDV